MASQTMAQVLRPPSREAAGAFVGTQLEVLWPAIDPSLAGSWDECMVVEVPPGATAGFEEEIILVCR